MINYVVKAFQDGGSFMYVILGISMVAIAIAVERIYFIVVKYNINGSAFMEKIKKLVHDGRLKEAASICKGTASILPKIVLSAIENAARGEAYIQNAVDVTTMEVIPKIERRTHYLAMLANVATLTGLLGTISGLIQAFAAVANADPSQKAELLAKGISLAMNTTAYGLIVAIPTLIVYAYIQSKTKKIMDEIDLYSVMAINLLTENREH